MRFSFESNEVKCVENALGKIEAIVGTNSVPAPSIGASLPSACQYGAGRFFFESVIL